MTDLPTIAVDFDGTICTYDGNFGEITGEIVSGFFDWLVSTKDKARVVVFSTRARDELGHAEISTFLHQQWGEYLKTHSCDPVEFEITSEKPSAIVYIDDRGLRFEGDWSSPLFSVDSLLALRTWEQTLQSS